MNTCEYCGQVVADGICDCPEARRQAKIADQIARAKDAVEELFGEKCADNGYSPVSDESKEIMFAAVDLIANRKIYAMSIGLPSSVKASIKLGSAGTIKVERSDTKKNSSEIKEEG